MDTSKWALAYSKDGISFPSEYVIRIFKGVFPKCNLEQQIDGYNNKHLLDVSCGDGRDFVLFNQLGFKEIAGTEISKEIVMKAQSNMDSLGIKCNLKVGYNDSLPFENSSFDILLSWNVCYYVGDNLNFQDTVKEYARVLKKGGGLVFSIPKPECFIYHNCIDKGHGLVTITNDPYGVRNGTVLKRFMNEQNIISEFESFFADFTFASINDDCFGRNYSWFIGYCFKK